MTIIIVSEVTDVFCFLCPKCLYQDISVICFLSLSLFVVVCVCTCTCACTCVWNFSPSYRIEIEISIVYHKFQNSKVIFWYWVLFFVLLYKVYVFFDLSYIQQEILWIYSLNDQLFKFTRKVTWFPLLQIYYFPFIFLL